MRREKQTAAMGQARRGGTERGINAGAGARVVQRLEELPIFIAALRFSVTRDGARRGEGTRMSQRRPEFHCRLLGYGTPNQFPAARGRRSRRLAIAGLATVDMPLVAQRRVGPSPRPRAPALPVVSTRPRSNRPGTRQRLRCSGSTSRGRGCPPAECYPGKWTGSTSGMYRLACEVEQRVRTWTD